VRKGETDNSGLARGGRLNTIIGKGTVVKGDSRVQSGLRIDGKVIGNIDATDTVIIGKEGWVEGQIKASHVLLAGKVKGNIVASGKVFLESTASIFGDIKASTLVIDEGAVFDGKCIMKSGETKYKKDETTEK